MLQGPAADLRIHDPSKAGEAWMRWQLWKEQGGLLTSPSSVPIALFTSLTLAALMLAAIWARGAENGSATQREAAALRTAIAVERQELVARAAFLARADEDVSGMAAAELPRMLPAHARLFSEVFIVDLKTGAARQ